MTEDEEDEGSEQDTRAQELIERIEDPAQLIKSKRKKLGRPTKMTKRVLERLLTSIVNGNYYEIACKTAGISYATFRSWITQAEEMLILKEKGEKGWKQDYLNFLEVVHEAEALAEEIMVSKVQAAAADGDWRAGAWLLERRHPERWQKRFVMEAEVTGEFTVTFKDVEAPHIEDDDEDEDDPRV